MHKASKVHEARVSVIPVLVAEIVIKLQREMDAKIGLDTNYQKKKRHLCKYLGSLNFSLSEPSLLCDWDEREVKGKGIKNLPSLIPTDETLILVWLESSAKIQKE